MCRLILILLNAAAELAHVISSKLGTADLVLSIDYHTLGSLHEAIKSKYEICSIKLMYRPILNECSLCLNTVNDCHCMWLACAAVEFGMNELDRLASTEQLVGNHAARQTAQTAPGNISLEALNEQSLLNSGGSWRLSKSDDVIAVLTESYLMVRSTGIVRNVALRAAQAGMNKGTSNAPSFNNPTLLHILARISVVIDCTSIAVTDLGLLSLIDALPCVPTTGEPRKIDSISRGFTGTFISFWQIMSHMLKNTASPKL